MRLNFKKTDNICLWRIQSPVKFQQRIHAGKLVGMGNGIGDREWHPRAHPALWTSMKKMRECHAQEALVVWLVKKKVERHASNYLDRKDLISFFEFSIYLSKKQRLNSAFRYSSRRENSKWVFQFLHLVFLVSVDEVFVVVVAEVCAKRSLKE